MTKLTKILMLGAMFAASLVPAANASQLIYRPINPSLGGDPLNGNWLLASGQAQQKGSSGGTGFSIDFPDFGDLGQDGLTDETDLDDVDGNN